MDEEQVIPVEVKKNKGGRPKGSTKKVDSGNSGISAAEVTEMMKALVSEMKKPSEAEQKKLDDERERNIKSARARAEEARRTAEEKRMQIAACKHIRPDEKHTFVGQVSSDGFIRGTCIRCPYEFGPITATQHQKESGANLNLIPDLTAAKLSAWTEATLKGNPGIRNSEPSWKVA